MNSFIGLCMHGRDPYDRCEICGDLSPEKAEALAKSAEKDDKGGPEFRTSGLAKCARDGSVDGKGDEGSCGRTMNDHQIELMLQKLVQLRGMEYEYFRTREGYSGRVLDAGLKKHITRKDFDDCWIVVSFKNHTIQAFTSLKSGHNGDCFGEQEEKIPWECLADVTHRLRYELIDAVNDRLKKEEDEARYVKAGAMVSEMLENAK